VILSVPGGSLSLARFSLPQPRDIAVYARIARNQTVGHFS